MKFILFTSCPPPRPPIFFTWRALQKKTCKDTNERMSSSIIRIQILISTPSSVRDKNLFVLPRGDYYFTVNKMGRIFIRGIVTGIRSTQQSRLGTPPVCNLPFEFKTEDMIQMMAYAQGKLASRLGLSDHRLPIPGPSALQHSASTPSLPQIQIQRRTNSNSPPPICTICRDNLGRNDIRRLPCAHAFHRACLRPWLQHHTTCPICRGPSRRVRTHYHRVNSPRLVLPPIS